jgi:hypothetical protein
MINNLPELIKRSSKPWSLPAVFSSSRSTFQQFAAIANYGLPIVESVRMISASLRLSSNNRESW